MPSLVDIAPQVKTVPVGGVDVEVRGIGIDAIARALAGSDELRRMMVGRTVDAMGLLTSAPQVVYALIAEAMGKPGDEAEQKAAAGLPFVDQLSLIEAIMELSFPGGINPFFERLVGMLGQDPGALTGLSGRVQGTSSLPQSTN